MELEIGPQGHYQYYRVNWLPLGILLNGNENSYPTVASNLGIKSSLYYIRNKTELLYPVKIREAYILDSDLNIVL